MSSQTRSEVSAARKTPQAHAFPAVASQHSSNASPAAGSRLDRYHVTIVLALGLLIRLWLIHAFPVIFGGDSVVRLANRDKILISYQLPALQAAIHYLGFVSTDAALVRWFMAAVGAVAGWGFYLLASALLGRAGAFVAAAFFVTNPFLVAYSIVPYQEILMLASLFFAFHFFFAGKWLAASAALALACFTRYEAWAAVPVFVGAFALQGAPALRSLAKGTLLFAWAPLAWTLYHAGIAPPGAFVLDFALPLDRFWRYAYLSWITVKFTPPPVLLLAVFGLWCAWSHGLWRSRRYLMLAAFVALFLAAILFSAHGERDQPDRFVTARESHILLSAVALLAGLGFSRLRRLRIPVLVLCVFWGIFLAHRFVASETADSKLRLSYDLALYLDQHVRNDQSAVVFAKPVPAALISRYLEKTTAHGGLGGRRRALENLRQLDISPPDYQRTLVHSRLGKGHLRSLSTPLLSPADEAFWRSLPSSDTSTVPGEIDWLAVWSDFQPANTVEARLLEWTSGREPLHTLTRDSHAVRIYSNAFRPESTSSRPEENK
jgi:hypothetical protein